MRPIHARKLLAIPLLPHHGPPLHHPPRDRDKDHRGPAPRHERDADPRHDLKQVVRARHPVKPEALRDAPGRGAARAQIAQHDVRVEVRELAVDVEREAGVDGVRLRVGQRGEGPAGHAAGREHEVRDVEPGEDPVVRAVAQDVGGGHGGGGELVHEHGLELALEEVQQQHPHGERLHVRQRLRGVRAEEGGGVDVRTQGVSEEEREEQRACVLDQVDGAPGDLGAEVLHVDGAGGLDAGDGGEVGGAVLDDALGGRVDDRDAVVVAGARAARDDALGLVDGRAGADLDVGGEVADGFLARCGGSVGCFHMLAHAHLREMKVAGRGDIRGTETVRVIEDAILQSIILIRVQLNLNCLYAQWMARRKGQSCRSSPEIIRTYGPSIQCANHSALAPAPRQILECSYSYAYLMRKKWDLRDRTSS